MNNEMAKAVEGFKKAMAAFDAYSDKPVVLEKGKTLLVKTSRARNGSAMVNGR
jgi:hypothetical protein